MSVSFSVLRRRRTGTSLLTGAGDVVTALIGAVVGTTGLSVLDLIDFRCDTRLYATSTANE